MSEKIYNSILGLHKKIDDINKDIKKIEVAHAPIPFRIKVLEVVVYGGIALVLMSVAGDTLNNNKANAETSKVKIEQISKNTKKTIHETKKIPNTTMPHNKNRISGKIGL